MAFGPLVTPEWLLDSLAQHDLVVVDCRWALGSPGAGRHAWEEEHIPGAHFLDVDEDLSGPPGEGRHPLPTADDFAATAASAGIGSASAVVAYDESGEGGAARLWWLLRHFGHDNAAVLDGGLRGWIAAGGPLDDVPPRPWSTGEQFEPHERKDDVFDTAAIAKRVERGDETIALVDARAPARFRGEMEPIDPVAGHIPGARNVPFASLAPDGRYLDPAQLRSQLDPGEGRELVAYCGSGITSATLVLAAEVAGLRARLYPGSWSDWCSRDLPVAAGRD
jgi:thiosulfate/3-mercaptopyruvate sulfurtransferase